MRGAPAIRASDCIGCGFNLQEVQRLAYVGTEWVPITPPACDGREKGACSSCGGRAKKSKMAPFYCCMACRRLQVGNEEAGEVMVHHLETWSYQFGRPAHRLDTICRVCYRCFCLTLCPDHLQHQGHQDATGADLVHIHHVNGMPFVDHADLDAANLPEGFVYSVQSVTLHDRVMYPIHRRPPHEVVELGDPCTREGCWGVTHGEAEFCSLRCWRG